jgi:pyrroloquinoline quinone (PQQ) biosynthesis protein C
LCGCSFIRAIGISDEERESATALKPTQELIDYRMGACLDKERYPIGAAAVLVASEGQNLETVAGEARHTLFGKVYNLKEEDLLFFSVHQKEDVGHVRQGMDLLAACALQKRCSRRPWKKPLTRHVNCFMACFREFMIDRLGLGQLN